jgi:soluble lytic murein transglycosylase-like protein
MGLMQLMPDTARLYNVLNAFDPVDNVEGGVRHLRMLLERYQGDLRLSLAAYNAGSGAVEKYGGIPPFAETREYVRRVLRFYEAFRGSRS